MIHNGKSFIPITISEEMVGHKLGNLHQLELLKDIRQQIKKLQQKKQQQRRHHQEQQKMQKNNNIVKAVNKKCKIKSEENFFGFRSY